MKIAIICMYGNYRIIETQILPRVGDRIDMFYTPRPVVNSVLLYPSNKSMDMIEKNLTGLDAIVMAE